MLYMPTRAALQVSFMECSTEASTHSRHLDTPLAHPMRTALSPAGVGLVALLLAPLASGTVFNGQTDAMQGEGSGTVSLP